jgi:hypothetical protein
MFSTKTLVSAVLIALPFAAVAGTRDPGVNQRQHNQQHRIQQGVKSGELTRGETRRLATEQRHIRHEEARDKSDGQLTRRARRPPARSEPLQPSHHNQKTTRDVSAGRGPRPCEPKQDTSTTDRPGVRSGELTRGETNAFRAEQRSIRQEERLYVRRRWRRPSMTATI